MFRKRSDFDADSGVLTFVNGVIRYESPLYASWSLALSDVRVIGESTNELGPGVDDYLFCFATGPTMWRKASFYASGLDAFLDQLATDLGAPIELRLVNSTTFASRVLWPEPLAGEPMFKYTDNPRSWLGQLLFGACSNTQTHTEEVARYLDRTHHPSG